jgi:hypothetical protein
MYPSYPTVWISNWNGSCQFIFTLELDYLYSDSIDSTYMHQQESKPTPNEWMAMSVNGVGTKGDPCTLTAFWSIVCPFLLYSTSSPIPLTKYTVLHNRISSFIDHVNGVRYLRTAATNRPIVHSPGDILVWRAMVIMMPAGEKLLTHPPELSGNPTYQPRHLGVSRRNGWKSEISGISSWDMLMDL